VPLDPAHKAGLAGHLPVKLDDRICKKIPFIEVHKIQFIQKHLLLSSTYEKLNE
jgi:hypothetical protein